MQRLEKMVSISRAQCFCGWSLSGMATWLLSMHCHLIGRCTYILINCFDFHVLISVCMWRQVISICTWRQFHFLDVWHGCFLNLDNSIWWRSTCTLGLLLLALWPFAGTCTFTWITLWLCLIFSRWWWPCPLSFRLQAFIFGFSWARPFEAGQDCNMSPLSWASYMIRFASHSTGVETGRYPG